MFAVDTEAVGQDQPVSLFVMAVVQVDTVFLCQPCHEVVVGFAVLDLVVEAGVAALQVEFERVAVGFEDLTYGLFRGLILVDAVVARLAHEPGPRAQGEGVERTASFVAAVLGLGDECVDVAGVGTQTSGELFATVAGDV